MTDLSKVATIWNENWEKRALKLIHIKGHIIMRIGEIASGAEYEMDEEFQNMRIFRISIVLQIENLLIFEFRKFQKCPIWKIPKRSKIPKLTIFATIQNENWENRN